MTSGASIERREDQVLPERFRFSSEESALAVRAVADYAVSSLRSLEADWNLESYNNIFGTHKK